MTIYSNFYLLCYMRGFISKVPFCVTWCQYNYIDYCGNVVYQCLYNQELPAQVDVHDCYFNPLLTIYSHFNLLCYRRDIIWKVPFCTMSLVSIIIMEMLFISVCIIKNYLPKWMCMLLLTHFWKYSQLCLSRIRMYM